MMRYDRYDKNVIEPYALSTIAYSYDLSYKNYFRPKNTDNFDYISQDGKRALEISLVISENEREAYIYDKELNNKKDPDPLRIKDVRIEENGNIVSYRGGS